MKKRAIMTEKWKLIAALEPDIHGFPPIELYDLEKDLGERENLTAERPDIVSELLTVMHEHVSRRTLETGLPDPLPLQPIPLKRIGKMEAAVPRDENGNQKLSEGDFKGYERKC